MKRRRDGIAFAPLESVVDAAAGLEQLIPLLVQLAVGCAFTPWMLHHPLWVLDYPLPHPT